MEKNTSLDSSRDFDNAFETSRPISNLSSYIESPTKAKNAFDAPAFEKKERAKTAIKRDINKPDQPESNENIENKDQEQKKSPMKLLLHFFLKNLGMVFVVILYVAGGAYLFKILEEHKWIQDCQTGEGEWNKLKSSYRSKLFNYIYFNTTSNPWLPVDASVASLSTSKDGPSVYNPLVRQWLIDFRDEVLNIRNTYRYTGQNCESQSPWIFFSALLFTISIVSTLGYGHVAPITWEGQIVCICYATLGIPLFLITLAKISSILGDMCRYFYEHVFCYACHNGKKSENKTKKEEDTENNLDPFNNKETKEKTPNVVDDNESEEEEEEPLDKVTVPLVFVIVLFIGYLILGAYIFSQIEKWNLRESAYFSFISLSTIGFGDYVPGIGYVLDGDEGKGGRNLVIAVIYIVIGMSLMGMSIELMQDEFVEKISLISKKLGFSKSEDDEDESVKTAESTEIQTGNNIRSKTMITIKENQESELPYHEKSNVNLRLDERKEPTIVSVKAAKKKQQSNSNEMPGLENNLFQPENQYIENDINNQTDLVVKDKSNLFLVNHTKKMSNGKNEAEDSSC